MAKRGPKPFVKTKKRKLTARQEQFCQEFIKDLDATAAYERAGYTVKNKNVAHVQAFHMMNRVDIQERIAELQATRSKRTKITQDMIVQELAKLAFTNPIDFVKIQDGKIVMKDVTELDPQITAAIAGIQEGPHGLSLKFHDKKGSLELLGKHLGMWPNKVDVNHGGGLSVNNEHTHTYHVVNELLRDEKLLDQVIGSGARKDSSEE